MLPLDAARYTPATAIPLLESTKDSWAVAICRDLSRYEHFSAQGPDSSEAAIAVARRVADKVVRSACITKGIPSQGVRFSDLLHQLRAQRLIDTRILNHCLLFDDYGLLDFSHQAELSDDPDRGGPSAEESEICARSISVIIDWYCSQITPLLRGVQPGAKQRALSLLEAGELGVTPNELLTRIMDLDRRCYGDIPTQHEGLIEQWVEKWCSHPDSGRVILAPNGQVSAYWSTACLYDDDFEAMKAGEMSDGEITPNRLRSFELPGVYKLYFVSICIDDAHRSAPVLRTLLNSFADVVEDMAEQSVYFDELCANAYTAKGEALCRSVGLKYLRPHRDHGKVYWDRLIPLQCVEFFQSRKALVEHYKTKCQIGALTAGYGPGTSSGKCTLALSRVKCRTGRRRVARSRAHRYGSSGVTPTFASLVRRRRGRVGGPRSR